MTTLSIIDTETTGDGPTDQVLELAVVTIPQALYTGLPSEIARWTTLIRPTVPVDVRARAVHHVTDAMLADSWTMAELLERRGLPELRLPNDLIDNGDGGRGGELVVVAHNLEFDQRMLRQSIDPALRGGGSVEFSRKICTWRCAMHLWKDAPSHKLQVLRYWLGLDEDFIALRGTPHQPHRALYDANVCAALLLHMLTFNTVKHLEHLTSSPVLLGTVRFGEHEGKPWSQVPAGYLDWVIRGGPEKPRVEGRRKVGWDSDTLHTARHWRAVAAERWSRPPPAPGG